MQKEIKNDEIVKKEKSGEIVKIEKSEKEGAEPKTDAKSKQDEYRAWYANKYMEIIGLSKVRKYAANKPDLQYLLSGIRNFDFYFSSLWRHESMANIKYLIQPKKSEYITVVFKISRQTGKKEVTETIYAVMYVYPKFRGNKVELDFEYVSHSPTYRSADGEYRHRFLPVKQITDVRSANLDLFEKVEKYTAEQLNSGEISFNCEFNYKFKVCGEKGCNKKDIFDTLQNEIDKKRLTIIFYASSWIIECGRFIFKSFENHIFQNYHKAMFGKKDTEVYEKILPVKEKIEERVKINRVVRGLIEIIPNPKQKTLVTECGQKIIPLTIKMIENPNDIRLQTWRELFINSFVGDLVINGISPSFPLISDWFFISGVGSNIYDNRIYKVKEQHSQIASQIVKGLEANRSKTFINNKDGNPIYLSYKMENLSETIEIPMDFAEQDIIWSEYAVCTVSEHLGRTLADLPALLQKEKNRSHIGPIFSNFTWFSKYLFETVYALWCLNSFFNIIHGDLHLNNITTFRTVTVIGEFTGKIKLPNTHIVYQVGDQMFIFPHRCRFIALIDFSRGFIWNQAILEKYFRDTSLIESDHKRRLYALFEREMPEFTREHALDLNIAIEKNFDAVYRVAEALDLYKFVNEWQIHIELHILNNKSNLENFGDARVISKQIIPTLIKIRKHIFNFVHTNAGKIFKDFAISPNSIQRPNLEVLRTFFGKNLVENFKPNDEIHVIDFFSDQNQIQYNTREYDSFPPTIKFDKVIEMGLSMDEARMSHYDAYAKYIEKEPISEKIEKIAQEVRDEKPERRGLKKEKEKDQPPILTDGDQSSSFTEI